MTKIIVMEHAIVFNLVCHGVSITGNYAKSQIFETASFSKLLLLPSLVQYITSYINEEFSRMKKYLSEMSSLNI